MATKKKSKSKKSMKVINETELVRLVKSEGFDFLHQVVAALDEFEGESLSFCINLLSQYQDVDYFRLDLPNDYCRLSQLSSEIERFNTRFKTVCRIKDVLVDVYADGESFSLELFVTLEKPSGTEVRININ